MQHSFNASTDRYNFKAAWLIIAVLVASQLIYIAVCHFLGSQIQQPLAPDTRILLRTVFYALAIIILPAVRLLRFVLCRLNQTMPGNQSAQQRYLTTVTVCLALIEPIGLFGLLMFIFGDGFNSLYIFSVLALLGFFLQMPKVEEYSAIVAALKERR